MKSLYASEPQLHDSRIISTGMGRSEQNVTNYPTTLFSLLVHRWDQMVSLLNKIKKAVKKVSIPLFIIFERGINAASIHTLQ